MLDAVRPDIAVISPGWVNERVPMIAAATQTGCHIYCGKAMLELREPGDAYIYREYCQTTLNYLGKNCISPKGTTAQKIPPTSCAKTGSTWATRHSLATLSTLLITTASRSLALAKSVQSTKWSKASTLHTSSGGRRVELPIAYRSHPLAD